MMNIREGIAWVLLVGTISALLLCEEGNSAELYVGGGMFWQPNPDQSYRVKGETVSGDPWGMFSIELRQRINSRSHCSLEAIHLSVATAGDEGYDWAGVSCGWRFQ